MALQGNGPGVEVRVERAALLLAYMPLVDSLSQYRGEFPNDDDGEIALIFQAAKRTIIRRVGHFTPV